MGDYDLDLKVGDYVLVSNDYNKYIDVVKTITPKRGTIKLKNSGSSFDKYGLEITDNIWHKSRIQKLTEELHEQYKREKTISKCKSKLRDSISSLTYEMSVQILKVLEGENESEES